MKKKQNTSRHSTVVIFVLRVADICRWYLCDVKGALFDIKGTLLDVKGIWRGIICRRVK